MEVVSSARRLGEWLEGAEEEKMATEEREERPAPTGLLKWSNGAI